LRNLRAHEAVGLGLAVEHRHLVAQRRQVARHRQRRSAGMRALTSPLWSAATRLRRQIATGPGRVGSAPFMSSAPKTGVFLIHVKKSNYAPMEQTEPSPIALFF
jgi:hypothetical protein